jgi:hypothetical protein
VLEWQGIPDWYFPPPQDFYERAKPLRKYQSIQVDLSAFAGQDVIIRLYQHTLVRDVAPGNAYWKRVWID